jgi:hypothetical protein
VYYVPLVVDALAVNTKQRHLPRKLESFRRTKLSCFVLGLLGSVNLLSGDRLQLPPCHTALPLEIFSGIAAD